MSDFNPACWYRLVEQADPVRQGDQLFDLTLRIVVRDPEQPEVFDVGEITGDFIIATQSCDLADRHVSVVEVVPFFSLTEWLFIQPQLFSQLETIRRGHVPGVYLLPGWPEAPIPKAKVMRVVAFDEKRTISFRELDEALAGQRLGLRSPYIEHFEQAVARFYMRVGLPEDMRSIKWKAFGEGHAEHVALMSDDLASVGLNAPAKAQSVRIQKQQMDKGTDTLYKASLEPHGDFFGIGSSGEEAYQSLLMLLADKRREKDNEELPEGKNPHWLVTMFPSTT